MVKCQHSLVHFAGVKTEEVRTSRATSMDGFPTIHLQRASKDPGSKEPGFLFMQQSEQTAA
jgi:hypothetical protein